MKEPLVEPSVLAELSDAMGADFAEELVATFLNDAPNMMGELKQAAETEDAHAYRRAAHSIKSNAEVFGAFALANMARHMEQSGLAGADSPVDELVAIYEATRSVLQGMLDD